MTRALSKTSKGIFFAGAIVACLAALPAQAEVQIQISPPGWYVATNRPTYYEGRPSYYYRNQWHYRQGRTWHTYREEPRFLRDRRMGWHRENYRRQYGRDHQGGYDRR